jgi:glycosyltransferase involved in cell wall biosynthesis
MLDTLPDDVELWLVTTDRDLGSRTPYPGLSGRWIARGRARVFYLDTRSPGQCARLWRHLRRQRFDLLYVNSLWLPTLSLTPILLARLGLLHTGRVLVAPRGELSPGALSLKARKKRLFLAGWARLLRRMDAGLHATSRAELEDIAAVLPWSRIEYVPNQTGLPPEPLPPLEAGDGPARLVFLGRIVPKKNLLLVLDALRLTTTPLRLDVYGPAEDAGYWQRCRDAMARLPDRVDVRYLGELPPDRVREVFAGYDAFVFPTLGENFGHVIAESLSASCPVLCSPNTPWTDVLESGGGRVVHDPAPAALAAELDRLAAAGHEDRLKARRLAGEAYRRWRSGCLEVNLLDQLSRSARGGER